MSNHSFVIKFFSFSISLLLSAGLSAMEPESYEYCLNVKKLHNVADKLAIEISKQPRFYRPAAQANAQTCSFVANFATHTCDNQQNLFEPFSTAKNAVFGDLANHDSFIWNVPDFGLLKLHRDGTAFFGHGAQDVPLVRDELIVDTTGKLFLETVKVAGLRIKSKEAQLCEAIMADKVYVDNCVQNSGCLKTKQLAGPGELLNEALLELEGTPQKPAILDIKKFQNNKSNNAIAPTVRASHLHVTSNNGYLNNNADTSFEVSDLLTMDPALASLFRNKGLLKAHTLTMQRETENSGFLQAHTMTAGKAPLNNKEFGRVKILDGMSVQSLTNEGEIDVHRYISTNNAVNKGTIAGSPDLSLNIDQELNNYGQVKISRLLGKGTFKNFRNLFFTKALPSLIQKLDNQTLAPDKKAKIEGKGLYLQGGTLSNEAGADICLNGELSLASAHPYLGIEPDTISRLSHNKGKIAAQSLNLFGAHKLENSGSIETELLQLNRKTLLNNLKGASIAAKNRTIVTDNAEIKNAGNFALQGDSSFTGKSNARNTGTMIYKQGTFDAAAAQLINDGNWLMEGMRSTNPFDMQNNGTLQSKESSLKFNRLTNAKDLILNSGVYSVDALVNINGKLQLLNNNWVITDGVGFIDSAVCPHKLICKTPPCVGMGEVECERNLIYDILQLPNSLTVQGDLCTSNRFRRDINQLNLIKARGKVTAWCKPFDILTAQDSKSFPDIGHLELWINGPVTNHYSLKAPALSLHTDGPLVLGKDNQQLGIIAATHGPLTVSSPTIDGRYGKFYGKGKTYINSSQGDILVGASMSKGPFLYGHNGSYIASGNELIVQAAKELKVHYGQIISQGKQIDSAGTKINNVAGALTSYDNIGISTPEFINTRDSLYTQPVANWTWAYSGCYNYCESSDQAFVRALGSIYFNVDKGTNLASSILAGKDIFYMDHTKGLISLHSPSVKEKPSSFTSVGRTNYGYGCNDKVGYQQGCSPCSSYSSTILSGQSIQIAIGDVVVTGNMNSPLISIQANTGLFANNSLSRQTLNPTQPIVVNVTQYLQGQAKMPGILKLGANNAVQTEFPLGIPSVPKQGDLVLLENQQRATPLQWKNIFNPLSTINLDIHLQQLLANLAGKVYAKKAKGNQLAAILWANANKWRQKKGKEVMSPSDLQQVNRSMLLSQILHNGVTEQQQTLLCIAPDDINPYQSPGDTSGDKIAITTTADQTHLNNRVVANGPEGITIKSGRDVNLETQSYTVSSETKECKVVEQRAKPQQQLLAKAGPIAVTAQHNVNRTGELIAAAGNVTVHAETGSAVRNPLILQTTVEKRGEEKSGLFSTTEKVDTSITHQVLPSTTISGTKIHEKAAVPIKSVAPQDSAGKEIVYESPDTVISGIILADRTIHQSHTSGLSSEQSSFESKEKPCAVAANIEAPIVQFIGKQAHVNATIVAKELHDKTEQGIQFVRKVAQMLCSGQSLASSPFMSVDAGYAAGYETMIAPILMVEKIVRAKDTGCMLFESAIIDKNRTEIIGKFVETTYQLKQWQTSWNHTSQLIPNEALVVIALAIALATQGAGVELMTPLLESITAATGMQLSAAGIAAINAGFSTICSSMGTSLLRTGDLVGTIEQLTSPAQLKSIAFSMAPAGLCSQLGDMLKVNMKPELKSFVRHVKEQALRGTVDTLLNIAINHESVDKAVSDAVKQVPLKAAAAYAANKICTAYLAGNMNLVSQKAAQTLVGGLSGFAAEQSLKGFTAGATGALTAELVGDYLLADAQAISDAAVAKLKAAGK